MGKQTKQKITKTTTKAPKTTIMVKSNSHWVSVFRVIDKSKMCQIVQITDVKSLAKGCRFWDKPNKQPLVEKKASVNVNLGGIYKNAVEKIMGYEDIEGNFIPVPHKFAVPFDGVVMIHKDDVGKTEEESRLYVMVRYLRVDSSIYRWKDSKIELTEEETEDIKSFLYKKTEGSRQPTEKKVIIRTPKISSIHELKTDHIRYQRI